MKVKLYSALCVLYWICFAFISCTDDKNGPLPPPPSGGENVYFSLQLATGESESADTRGYIATDKLSDWENRVSDIWMLLYSNDKDATLQYFFKLKVTNFENNTLINFKDTDSTNPAVAASEDTKLTTIAQEVKRNDYKLVVLANAAKTFEQLSLSEPQTEDPISDLESVMENIKTEYFGGGEDNSIPFFMSNANGIVNISTSNLHETKEEAQTKPVSINLDRLLAKVIVKEGENGVGLPAGVTLDSESVKWYLDVVNKQTYLIRKFAPFADETMETIINSKDANRINIYAEDPNFDGGEKDKFITKTETYTPPTTQWIVYGKPVVEPSYQYVFENTMTKEAQKNTKWADYTTQIVLEANLFYTAFITDANDPKDPGKYYYSYNGKAFTHEQVRFWIERGFPTEMTGLKEKVDDNIKEWDKSGKNAFNFKATKPNTDATTCETYFEITLHPQGLNAYRIPIRHFVPKAGVTKPREETYGYYGVVRNNTYTVTINSLNGPGDNYEDPEDSYLSVDIAITPWFLRDFQEEDLGYN